MRAGASEKLVRRNILLPAPSVNRLAELRRRTEATSDTEVLRNALRVYEQLVEDAEEGKELVVRNRDDGTEIVVRIR
jgi:hypothetical protein